MTGSDLRDFFADRLKVQLREQGARHDLADAVLAVENENDLVTIVRRVEALAKFLETDDGKNLLAGTKRAANILRIEEKKDGRSYAGDPDPSLLKEPEEMALAEAMVSIAPEASAAYAQRGFRRRDGGDGEAAPGGRCLFRKGDRECRRQGAARKPADAAQPDARSHPHRRRFFEDRRLTAATCATFPS